jgi:lysozyme
MMQVVRQALTLIEMFEGLRLKTYLDAAGHETIGFGHKLEAGESYPDGITEEQALALLQQDLLRITELVQGMIAVPVSDNQYSALVSFAYNLGPMALQRSSLLRKLNEGDYAGAAGEFHRWVKAGPRGNKTELKGLVKRRAAEELMFRTPDPVYAPTLELWAGRVGDPEGAEFFTNHPTAMVIGVAPKLTEARLNGADPEGDGFDGEGEGG